VQGNNAQALALLENAVNINSGTNNADGVTAVGALFAEAYAEAGFTTRWVPGAAFGRGGHLVAEIGERGPKVLMIGHLDTVFASDSPFQRFERVDEQHARWPGYHRYEGR
jgi:glutamate carboxypeptidase